MTQEHLSHFQSLLSPDFWIVELDLAPDITSQDPLLASLPSNDDNEMNNSLLDSEGNLTMFPREGFPSFPLQQRSSERVESPLFVSRDSSEAVHTPYSASLDPNDPEVARLNVGRSLQPTVEDVRDEGQAQGQISPQHPGSFNHFRQHTPPETDVNSSPEPTRIQMPMRAELEIAVDAGTQPFRRSHRSKRSIKYSRMHNSSKRSNKALFFPNQSSQVPGSSRSRSISTSSTQSLESSITSAYQSHYIRSHEALTSRFGERTEYRLQSHQIVEVIRMGDSFLRDDLGKFISSCLDTYERSLWNSFAPYAPHVGSPVERLFKSLNYAQILTQRCNIDPLRLRQARVLLQCYYEQLRKDPHIRNGRLKGRRDASSTAIDFL
jgi:hypothetical protein